MVWLLYKQNFLWCVCLFVCFPQYILGIHSVLSNLVVTELISPGSSHMTPISSLQELWLCYIRKNVESSSQWNKILHWQKLQKASESRQIDKHGLNLNNFITEFFTWSFFSSIFHLLTLVKTWQNFCWDWVEGWALMCY